MASGRAGPPPPRDWAARPANEKPGQGELSSLLVVGGLSFNFSLVLDIVRAERAIKDACEALRSIETRGGPLIQPRCVNPNECYAR